MSVSKTFAGSPVISIVLNAHTPFVGQAKQSGSYHEHCFFDVLSETYIPLLEVFDRLDRDRVPFKMAISLSPVLCHMLNDKALMTRYLEYTDKQIEFGRREMETLPETEKIR